MNNQPSQYDVSGLPIYIIHLIDGTRLISGVMEITERTEERPAYVSTEQPFVIHEYYDPVKKLPIMSLRRYMVESSETTFDFNEGVIIQLAPANDTFKRYYVEKLLNSSVEISTGDDYLDNSDVHNAPPTLQ